ncbi:Spc34p [Saccharomyces paradoxus]|uniref:DASH complex subunit SPC34 n=1 Tax=Saccharomyces paradoxus TaxID=27291 RepID=A0A8B8UVB5_SACPA|nr:Spc34 [Saccharomyces paradoxus]QHS74626.1 Spc34 [Saccharomyces paradoxus]
MAESLDGCIDDINRAVDSMSTLYFKPPGIFHNAILQGASNKANIRKDITRLIKDCNHDEAYLLFKVNPEKQSVSRRDGKEGVFDYVNKRDTDMKRNRRLGKPGEKPIIHVPKEVYLNKDRLDLNNKRRRTATTSGGGLNSFIFDTDLIGSSVISNSSSGTFKALSAVFKDDPQIQRLLYALENGSVLMEEESNNQRRKTIFVEDFPTDLILKVMAEVTDLWPLTEFKQDYDQLYHNYEQLSSKLRFIKKEVLLQDDRLKTMSQYHPSSSHDVAKIIRKEKDEIRRLEMELTNLQKQETTSARE